MSAPTPLQRTLSDSVDKTVRMVTIPPGGDADVAATIVVDTSALTGGSVTATTHTITRLVWSLSGFSVTLNFDASSDVPCFTMARGIGSIDLRDFGGITNNASSPTGDIEFMTNGIAAADDDEDDNAGWFLIETKKVV